jgi:hypothetical protein
MNTRSAIVVAIVLATSCGKDEDKSGKNNIGPAPAVISEAPVMRRLTLRQFEAAVSDLFGDGLVLPTSLEPDTNIDGLLNIGAGVTSVSPWGTERYEDAAYLLAEQALADDAWRTDHIGCTTFETACVDDFVATFGRTVYRRPLVDAEISRIRDVIDLVATDSGDFELGMQYGIAALLQSPYFIYRMENGDGDGERLLDDWEVATRLSFLLWNTIPDDALLDAAANGDLTTDSGLREHAERMMKGERFRDGVRAVFTDILGLYALDDLSKDPLIFAHAGADLGPNAREETLLGLEALIVDEDRDFRLWMTSQRTFINRPLAALYGVPAPVAEGFGEAYLELSGGRRGLLGQASILSLHAHSGSSSATRRGAFVLTTLLCLSIPPPPADVDTSIPEADAVSPTLRLRLLSHQEDPVCATCHIPMDGVGLGLENFDGVGQWRDTENGATIDPSGAVDQTPFSDAWELGQVIADDPAFGDCMTRHLYSFTTGQTIGIGQEDVVAWLGESFVSNGHSYKALMLETVLSPGFRTVGAFE